MKKTTKKRALVSSVAMLAVSAVAMGSATYAWFTNSSTAKVKGVNVSTTKLSNLQVAEHNVDSEFGNEVDFGLTKNLLPSSTGNLTAWYHTTAKDETASDRDTTSTISTVTTSDDYVVSKTFYIRSKNVDAENVQWSLDLNGTDATARKYLRVALVGGDGNVVWSSNETTTAGLTSTTGTTSNLTSASTVTGTLFSSLEADTVKQLTLYVWYEGQDTECFNATAGCTANVAINFSKA